MYEPLPFAQQCPCNGQLCNPPRRRCPGDVQQPVRSSFILPLLNNLLISCSGVKLMYLPPYSPDFNPIEECFSFMKAYIRRHGFRFRSEVETGHKDKPYMFLFEALNVVKAQDAWGWFHHSKYV